MMKIFIIFIIFFAFSSCNKYTEIQTKPITNNPCIIPNYGTIPGVL